MAFNREMHNSGCPCKDCENRTPGCHDTCEGYKAWRSGWDKMMETRREYLKSFDTISDSYIKHLLRKNRDKRHARRYDSLLKNR